MFVCILSCAALSVQAWNFCPAMGRCRRVQETPASCYGTLCKHPPAPAPSSPPFCATCQKPSKTVCISTDSHLWSSKAARRRRTAVPERKEPRPVTPTAPDCSSGTKMSLGRCYFQYKRALVPLNCRHKYGFALRRIGSDLGNDPSLLH